LLILIGAPGAGKTTAAKRIMELREKELGSKMQGQVLSVDHPDGARNKKGDGIKQVGAGVVLDGVHGLALLGRYAVTHNGLKKPYMEGADRLAVGKEKGTWSQLLRPSVSPLADYTLLVVDSCDAATIHPNHLKQAQAAGWEVRVRELAVDRDTSRQRCLARNYAGMTKKLDLDASSSLVQPCLTAMEKDFDEAFDAKTAELRTRFTAWDFGMSSQEEVLQEARSLLGGHAAIAATDARRGGAAAAQPAAPKPASSKRALPPEASAPSGAKRPSY
jgi:ABC-type dipeptide/oligopeptide/nickel transport system ATPase component